MSFKDRHSKLLHLFVVFNRVVGFLCFCHVINDYTLHICLEAALNEHTLIN